MDAVAEVVLAFELVDSRGGRVADTGAVDCDEHQQYGWCNCPLRTGANRSRCNGCRLSIDDALRPVGVQTLVGIRLPRLVGSRGDLPVRAAREGDVVIAGSMIPPRFPQPSPRLTWRAWVDHARCGS